MTEIKKIDYDGIENLADLFREWYVEKTMYLKKISEFLAEEKLDKLFTVETFNAVMNERACLPDSLAPALVKSVPFNISEEEMTELFKNSKRRCATRIDLDYNEIKKYHLLFAEGEEKSKIAKEIDMTQLIEQNNQRMKDEAQNFYDSQRPSRATSDDAEDKDRKPREKFVSSGENKLPREYAHKVKMAKYLFAFYGEDVSDIKDDDMLDAWEHTYPDKSMVRMAAEYKMLMERMTRQRHRLRAIDDSRDYDDMQVIGTLRRKAQGELEGRGISLTNYFSNRKAR
ncbi:MAG: hypothetical protein LBL47_00640 [Lactobacillus sp.]|nr:hypothetical protein [Lactobacillus sp.]